MRITTRSPSSPVELPTVTAVGVRVLPMAQTGQYHLEAGHVSRRRCNCYVPPRGADFHKIGQEMNKRNSTRFNSDPIPNATVMLLLQFTDALITAAPRGISTNLEIIAKLNLTTKYQRVPQSYTTRQRRRFILINGCTTPRTARQYTRRFG